VFNALKIKALLGLVGGFAGIKRNFLLPVLARLGTVTATWLLSTGITADHAQQIALGVTTVGLVIYDLIVDRLNRKAN